ncbi:hypothetical protein CMV_012945 [Castanea mollissima]|uniref:Histidine-containing phosphotransfer protein n=2 Tax=Castanea TaxID=21019 RepID=A0A8J4QZ09_9ROSI|nr:hypothetical protein CMV_012945 [Castanea mollissima]
MFHQLFHDVLETVRCSLADGDADALVLKKHIQNPIPKSQKPWDSALLIQSINSHSREEQTVSMEVGQMQRRLIEYTKSLFMEGILDDQFLQLQQLQDESNPDFVVEVVSLFFQDAEKLLNDITRALDQQSVDFTKVDAHVHQLKGSSASVGAQRVKNGCIAFRNFCEEQNVDGSLRCLQQIKQEYYHVKNKLEALFRLEQQIVAAGGSVPMMELSF